MARPFKGQAQVDAAQELRDQARTAQQMRQALAVLLPLQCGLTLEQTAQVLGRSREATCRLRNAFIAQHSGHTAKKAAAPNVRQQRHTQQAAILDEVLGQAAQGGVVMVPPLKPLIEARLGKPICLATLYNMLHRHGWRKLAPDTVHPKGDAQARAKWKKLSSDLAQIRLSFSKEQPLRVMFQDEARFGRISQCRRCWRKKPMRPTVKAMLTHQYTYAYGAVSPVDGRFDALLLPQVNGAWMQVFLDEIAVRYAQHIIIMVVDGASWHRSGQLRLPDNLKLHLLPPYSPELNPQEHYGMSCARSSSTTRLSTPCRP